MVVRIFRRTANARTKAGSHGITHGCKDSRFGLNSNPSSANPDTPTNAPPRHHADGPCSSSSEHDAVTEPCPSTDVQDSGRTSRGVRPGAHWPKSTNSISDVHELTHGAESGHTAANVHGSGASNPLNMCSLWNVQGLKPRTVPSKVPYVSDLLINQKQMFMVLTETWLREQKAAELKVDGYILHRADRKRPRRKRGRDSGGVAVYIRDDFAPDMEEVLSFSNGVVEVLGLYSKRNNLLLFAMYRQPDDIVGGNRSTSVEFKEVISKIRGIATTYTEPMPDIMLVGDFNLPHAVWPEGQIGHSCPKDEREMIQTLMDLAGEFFLQQFIEKPTHNKGNTLDLFFVNNSSFLHSYETDESIFSDHFIVECASLYSSTQGYGMPGRRPVPSPEYGTSTTSPTATQGNGMPGRCPVPSSEYSASTQGCRATTFADLNFFNENVDWSGLEEDMKNQEWDSIFHNLDPNQMLRKFQDICFETANKYVPMKHSKSSGKERDHIPRDRKILMRRRRRVNAQLRKTTSEARRSKLKSERIDIEKKLLQSYRQSRSASEHKAVTAIKRNSKYFYSYAKKFSMVKIAIGPLIDATKNIITCSKQMGEMLSQQYSSVFSIPKSPMPTTEEIFSENGENQPLLSDILFTEQDIVKAISEISISSAAGPDFFPALFLKNCKNSLAKPLFIIWRTSLDTGEIPQQMKTANIVPIHKGGSRGVPANYRPVALTSHLVKLFEKVIRNSMVSFMEEHGLFNATQHGFRVGRSCLSQLIAHFDNIIHLLETGQNVDVIYLDFAKAFDKVDFLVTLRKLEEMGITGKLGCWIHAFLTNRTQSVIVNGCKSQPKPVKSGVPQGSVLGPLLFLVLLGDIDQDVSQAFVSSFADDTRVAKGIATKEDIQALQSDLNVIYRWSKENNMMFNSKKFECVRYGPQNELRTTSHYTSEDGSLIEEVCHVRDLGVIMSNDAKFSKHINHIVGSAKSQCSWILRTFLTRDRVPMMTLWKSLVRSKLEYCCQLWNPLKKGDIQCLEQVQRNFFRKVNGMQPLTYWEQLKALCTYSLERRRERYLIIYIWRMMEGQVPNISHAEDRGIKTKIHIRRGRVCMVPTVNSQAPQAVKSLRYASFAYHAPRLFNILPAHIRNMTGCSVDTFKKKLDSYLSTVPDEPQISGYTAIRRVDSNSLLDMHALATAQLVNTLEEEDDSSTTGGGHPRSP